MSNPARHVLEIRDPVGPGEENGNCNVCGKGKVAHVLEVGWWNATMQVRFCGPCADKCYVKLAYRVGEEP